MHTKHWIPLTAHQFRSREKMIEHEEKCLGCNELLGHPLHRTDLIGAAVVDFLQSQGDGFVETKAVVMLANGALDVRSMIGHSGAPLLFAAPTPGVDHLDVFDESPIMAPPPRPRRRKGATR